MFMCWEKYIFNFRLPYTQSTIKTSINYFDTFCEYILHYNKFNWMKSEHTFGSILKPDSDLFWLIKSLPNMVT